MWCAILTLDVCSASPIVFSSQKSVSAYDKKTCSSVPLTIWPSESRRCGHEDGCELGLIPPSVHSVGTSNKSELLKTGATTTTQTAPREVRASLCCRDITPRDVTTPAANSGLHRMCARRDLSCLAKFAARAADDPEPLGGGQPAPRAPNRWGKRHQVPTWCLKWGVGHPHPTRRSTMHPPCRQDAPSNQLDCRPHRACGRVRQVESPGWSPGLTRRPRPQPTMMPERGRCWVAPTPGHPGAAMNPAWGANRQHDHSKPGRLPGTAQPTPV